MRFTSTIIISSLAACATAAVVERRDSFEFPEAVSLAERQSSGGKYECHSNCGFALKDSKESDKFCDDSEFSSLFQACLKCALEYDIWKYYGDGLTTAAKKCGIDATPEPAGGDDSKNTSSQQPSSSAVKTTAAVTSAAETTSPTESTPVESTPAESTSAESPPVTSAGSASDVATATSSEAGPTSEASSPSNGPATTLATSSAPTGGNSTVPTTSIPAPPSGASKNLGPKLLVGGAVILVSLNMI